MKNELKVELGRYLDTEGGVLPVHLAKLTDEGESSPVEGVPPRSPNLD